MYSVIRFMGSSGVELVGRCLNASIDGAYEGLRRRGDGFSTVVSQNQCWVDHETEIQAYVGRAAEAIRLAHQLGVRVGVDVAVYPEDYEGHYMLPLPVTPALLRVLAALEATLEFTVYWAPKVTTAEEP